MEFTSRKAWGELVFPKSELLTHLPKQSVMFHVFKIIQQTAGSIYFDRFSKVGGNHETKRREANICKNAIYYST